MFRYLGELVRLVWQTHRGYSVAMVALRLARGLVPIASLWTAKLIVDAVIVAQRASTGWSNILPLILLELGILLVGELLSRYSMVIDGALSDLFTINMSVRIMTHASKLDLLHFEDPTFYDHLERARQRTSSRMGLLLTIVAIVQSALTLATLAAAMLAFNAWLILLLIVAVLPLFFAESYFAKLQHSQATRWTQRQRELDYLRFLSSSNATAKEIQQFALAPWLIERFKKLSHSWFGERHQLVTRRAMTGGLLGSLGSVAYYVAYIMIISQAVSGTISVGTMTFLAASFSRGRELIHTLLLSVGAVYEESLYLQDLFIFLNREPTIKSQPKALRVPARFSQGVAFEDVGFKYPGSDRWAIRHVSFHLGPGECVGLVGENGAGKTTLIKLLARLYDASEGRITLDGVDVREYDLTSLRQAVGVIFQDFVRYDFRFGENIGVADIGASKDYLETADLSKPECSRTLEGLTGRLQAAADQSLASILLGRLPRGWNQMLGRRFDDGIELSGGEWQRIALARGYLRDAQLLILDEPTSSLDPRAEFETFKRFSALMRGRSSIVISHRFSTVRMAHRIIVLENGRVIEQGSHDELLAGRGSYAELFAMQAASYR